jgi:signal transduction histidine kinase
MRLAHWIAIDFIVGSFAALVCLFMGLRPGDPFGEPSRLPDSVVFATLVFLAVGLRRRGPLAAFGVLSAVVLLAAFSPVRIIDLMGLLALAYVLYLVTVTSTRRVGLAALSGGLLQIMAVEIAFYGSLSHGSGPAIPVALSMIIAWMTGYSVRQRRAYIEMLQVQAASSAVTQERLRIARELHDVVAHSMSVIAVQAGFGQYVIDDSPHDAREALGAIQATSRDALAELRRMLGVLRQQDMSASAPLTPECGLGELERLVHTTRGGGIEVALTRSGDVRDLPAGIDVSAYRIIQEALTNVVKHAGGGARCAVSVDYGDKSVTIAVTDDGGMGLGHPHSAGASNGAGTSNGAGAGHGLIGMRERVQLCGGELCAGPLPRGGFRVLAQLPIQQAAHPHMPALELVR